MIYQLLIRVSESEDITMTEHQPIMIKTLSDGGILEQTEAEQEMVAEAFKSQILDLIKFMSPVKKL